MEMPHIRRGTSQDKIVETIRTNENAMGARASSFALCAGMQEAQ
jgi:hypothetical protein